MSTKTIDLVSLFPHYRKHLLPIWKILPEEIKGFDWNDSICPDYDRILLVAGFRELQKIRHPHNKVLFLEHGAGQTYNGDRSLAYSNSTKGYNNVLGFICPNETVVKSRKEAYPNIPAIAVGCPKLDELHLNNRPPEPKSVCITFHWDCPVSRESHSAFPSYQRYLPGALRNWQDSGWKVYGHYHPLYPELKDFWIKHGIEVLDDDLSVLEHCSVLIADNTSLLFEFMSLKKPVVFINDPFWKTGREKGLNHHGLRFWEATEHGLEINTGLELQALDLDSVPASDGWHPYAFNDGKAAQRAADFITELLCYPNAKFD